MEQKHKRIAWTTAGLLLLASLPVSAAGLGKLTVMSTLGQPFKGEIDLLAVDKKDVGSLRARFASYEAFKEAKIDRSPSLTGMRFSVEQKKNGDPYLKITSSKAIDEPFLDMLIELDWSAGRLVREYTVLLDPPGYGEQTSDVAPMSVPVVKPVSAVPAQPAASPGPVSVDAVPAPAGAIQPEIRANIPLDKKLLAKKDKTELSEVVGSQPSDHETYGPVKTGQTLAGIATSLKPEGVSLDQMLVALFQSNKQAFSGSNMNRLKAGQILRVPDATQITDAMKSNEASKQVRAHAADWHAYRQKLAAAVAESKPVEEAAKQAASGKITTAVEDKAAAAKQPAADVLKLSKSEGLGGVKQGVAAPGVGAAGGKEVQGMKDQLHALQEESTAKEKAIKEANQRIGDLEKNIKEMQRLLELKNQNLADMQKQAAVAKAPPVVVPAPAPVAPVAVTPEVKPAAPVAEQKAPVVVAEKAPVVDEKPVVKPMKPKPPVVVEEKKPELSFIDEAMGNPIYLGGGAAVVILLGLLGAKALAGRRKKNVASFEDSVLTNGDLKANSVIGSTGGGKVDTGDTSFLTDFSQAGLGSIDTNEVDPIAEAEVYMAYGRDAQAEEILKEALIKDPNRHEIRLKMLEIYAGRKNLNAFESVAGEMYAVLNGQASPLWDKAAEIGRSLDPQNPLYVEQSKVAVAADDNVFEKTMIVAGGTAALVASADGDMEIDLGSLDVEKEAETEADLDFDLGTDTVAEVSPEAMQDESLETLPVEEEVAADLGFDLDLGAFGESPAEVEPSANISAVGEEASADAGLDFNLDLGAPTVAEVAPEPVSADVDETESAMEFDMGALTQAEPDAPVEEMISAEDWKDEVMGLDLGTATEAEVPVVIDAVAEVGNDLEMPDFSLGEEASPAGGGDESIELAAPPADESPLDFDFNMGQDEAAVPAESKKIEMPDLDLSGIDLDISESGSAKVAPSDLPDDFGAQEVSTKLDLARAYVDMGDVEGARDILLEVSKEGTPEQQAESQKMLADLG